MVIGIPLPEDAPPGELPGPVKPWMLVVSTLLVLWSAAIYAGIIVIIPAFRSLFAGFGADLPALTVLVLGYSGYAMPLVLIGVVPLVAMWRYRRSGSPNTNRDFRRTLVCFGLAMTVLGIAIAGLYLPVFTMGPVTS